MIVQMKNKRVHVMKNETFLKEFGQRVRNLRLNYPPKGMAQEELAIKAGYTSRSSINKIELGLIDVPQSKIIMLADALGCTPAYLMGWTNSPNDKESNNSFTPPSEHIVFFNELGKICAGYNGCVDEIPTGRKIPIPSSMLNGRDESEFFTLRVSGNSMYPRILEGDTIFCLRTDSVDSGDIAVIIYNGDEATVKKVNYIKGEDWLELIPFNPEYPVKRIEGSDLELCHVQGKVVKLIRDI